MNLVTSMLVTFVVTLVTAAVVTYVWSLVFHGAGAVDWEAAFVLGVAIGVAVPVADAVQRRSAGE